MVPEFSIGRNILLGWEGSLANRGHLSSEERRTVATVLAKVGASFDPDTKTSSLSVPHLRLAQIARALVHPGEIMILDEPTAVLSEPDAELLIDRVMQFRSEGKAVLYVTHRLSEVIRMADRITVLRDGKRVGLFLRGEVSRQDIVQLMTKDVAASGHNAERDLRRSRSHAGGVNRRIQIRNLSSGRRFTQANLTASSGRIVGIAGVQGSGHGHFLRAVAGVDAVTAGEITFDGHQLPLGSVRHAVRQESCWYRQIVAERRLLPPSPCAPIFVSAIAFVERSAGLGCDGREKSAQWLSTTSIVSVFGLLIPTRELVR